MKILLLFNGEASSSTKVDDLASHEHSTTSVAAEK
jgi:hypothetical protein